MPNLFLKDIYKKIYFGLFLNSCFIWHVHKRPTLTFFMHIIDTLDTASKNQMALPVTLSSVILIFMNSTLIMVPTQFPPPPFCLDLLLVCNDIYFYEMKARKCTINDQSKCIPF